MQPHEIFIKNNYFLYRKDENKEKEVANGPFLKIPCSSIQNVDSSSIAFHIIWTHERAILNLILDEKNLPHRYKSFQIGFEGFPEDLSPSPECLID